MVPKILEGVIAQLLKASTGPTEYMNNAFWSSETGQQLFKL
jgi:hypothetical protein